MTTENPSYRPHFERAPVGIFEVNKNGEYVDVNPFGCEMIGYSRDELLAMSIADLSPEGDNPEEIPSFAEVRETGEIRTEGALLHKDGDNINVLNSQLRIESVPRKNVSTYRIFALKHGPNLCIHSY